jgi:hypothetical protein
VGIWGAVAGSNRDEHDLSNEGFHFCDLNYTYLTREGIAGWNDVADRAINDSVRSLAQRCEIEDLSAFYFLFADFLFSFLTPISETCRNADVCVEDRMLYLGLIRPSPTTRLSYATENTQLVS